MLNKSKKKELFKFFLNNKFKVRMFQRKNKNLLNFIKDLNFYVFFIHTSTYYKLIILSFNPKEVNRWYAGF